MRHYSFPAEYKGKFLGDFGVEMKEEQRYSEHDGRYTTLIEKTNYCPNCKSGNTFVFKEDTDKWLCFDCFTIFMLGRDEEVKEMIKRGSILQREGEK